ncbi:hypothetical protein HNY73_010465 [Argiope bruennichi]|uniref:Uncharacterized protein n=1 Tax=Argiope bruennichi TaxID=94029 RepID=A0A8T0F622_ARGBR|nr:hypothetical protein HNY73_010465 [Argiope bruennichi]
MSFPIPRVRNQPIRNPATLKEMALGASAILISDFDKIRHIVEELHSQIQYEFMTAEAAMIVKNYPDYTETYKLEAEDKIKDLCMPETLKKELVDYSVKLCLETFKFLNINRAIMHETVELKDYVVLNADGSINHRKTHEKIVLDNDLRFKLRFASACHLYCVQDILTIWHEVSTYQAYPRF